MTRRKLRAGMLAGYGLVMSYGILPALTALLLRLRGTSAVQWSWMLSIWIRHHGYFPWKALAMVAHYPDTHLGLWLAMG